MTRALALAELLFPPLPIPRVGASRRLRLLLWRNAVVGLLPDHGWMDGGCLTLAVALQRWSHGAIALAGAVDLRTGRVTHVVGRLGRYVIDADGIATDSGFVRKMCREEGVRVTLRDGIQISDFDDSEIPLYLPAVTALTAFLDAEFGAFSTAVLGVDA